MKVVEKTKKIITVGINSLVSTTQPAYSNHMQLMYRLGRSYTDYNFCLVNPPRMSIDRMRNMAAQVALQNGSEFLLFIDDDVLVPQPFDFLHKLIACKADIAAADVLIRGYPFNHMLFRHPPKDSEGLIQVAKLPPVNKRKVEKFDAVGFSVCLIRVDLLAKMNKPYFVTGMTNTEDIYFCVNARRQFPKTTIVADTSIICGHILWSEVIDSFNKENYKQYQEKQYNIKMDSVDESNWRGEAYLQRVKKTFDLIKDVKKEAKGESSKPRTRKSA